MKKIKQNLKIIIPIIIVVLISIILLYMSNDNNTNKNNEVIKEKEVKKIEKKEENKQEEKYYYVDIKGSIKNPGVYKMNIDSRVIDVINDAGGLCDNADTSIINLSKKITDEMFIIIYSKDEIDKYKEKTISTNEIKKLVQKDTIKIDNDNDAEIKNISDDNSIIEEVNEGLVNINTASKEELLKVSGIGESKATAIIKYREEKGNFNSIEDIKNVSGIGDSLFEKIKEYITT